MAHHGEGRWNGVALLSRVGLDDVVRGLPDEPRFPTPDAPAEARAVTATCGGLRVTSVYVPNGRTPDDPHYAYKLEWLAALHASVTAPATAVVAGDMNIAPTDDDLWDPALFVDSTHVTPAGAQGRSAQAARASACTTSSGTAGPPIASSPTGTTAPGASTRTRACASTSCWPARDPAARVAAAWVDRKARKGSGPSDHAPVIVDLDTAPDGDIGPVVPPPSTPAKLPHRS